MYERFFNFKSKPFALNPDPTFLYPSRQHAAALTMLEYGIESQASFCQLIRMLGKDFTVGLISNTHERFDSILPWGLSALGVAPPDNSDIARYEALTEFVIREYGKGKRTLLIIDEAQNLPVQLLEELRLLSNVNSESDIALQTLLVGQPELRTKLERPELIQFAQRVSVDFHLECLTLNDARAYVRHRLTVAGGDPELFEPDAVAYIHSRASGVPRLMNQLCDLALVYAFADQHQSIDEQMVSIALQERNHGRAMRVFAGEPAVVPLTPKAKIVEAGTTSKRG